MSTPPIARRSPHQPNDTGAEHDIYGSKEYVGPRKRFIGNDHDRTNLSRILAPSCQSRPSRIG